MTASVDELHFHTYEPGYSYQISFLHDFDVDKINGGAGDNTCISGEVVNRCDGPGKSRVHYDAESVESTSSGVTDIRQR